MQRQIRALLEAASERLYFSIKNILVSLAVAFINVFIIVALSIFDCKVILCCRSVVPTNTFVESP